MGGCLNARRKNFKVQDFNIEQRRRDMANIKLSSLPLYEAGRLYPHDGTEKGSGQE